MGIIRITAFTLVLTLLLGIGYPLAITGIAQTLFPDQANGSLVKDGDKVIGSSLIAQNFASPKYFHPRPSAAGDKGYDAGNSSGSNLGVTSKDLIKSFNDRIAAAKKDNNSTSKVPADLVTASGSGLDPDITPEAAQYQSLRVATAHSLPVVQVQALIDRMTQDRALGVLGMPRVNVLAINRELDKMSGKTTP
jgi:K+-transporting ATPase ATPase C chain